MSDDHKARQPRAFFGRRKGHPLRPAQAALFETLLPRLALDLDALPRDLRTLFAAPVEAVRLEIGFGGAPIKDSMKRPDQVIQAPVMGPLSTGSVCPVIHPASLEARNATAEATSSGSPTRPSG